MVTKVRWCSNCERSVAALYDPNRVCRGCVIAATLGESQRQVLMAVRKLGPTTIGEVADECRFASTSSAWYHLKALRRKGLIVWVDGSHATITERIDWPQGERV